MTKVAVKRDGNVGIINMESEKGFHIFSLELFDEMNKAVDELEADDDIRVLIITGEGNKAFMAGSDIKYMLSLSVDEGMHFTRVGVKFFRRLELLKKPVIAAINGYCFGGGVEMSVACDVRIASTKAVLDQPEVHIGIVPGFNGTQRLPRIIGQAYAKEMILTGAQYSADECYRMGLVNKVVEPEELMPAAIAMAKQIGANSPLALAYAKQAINRGLDMDIDDGIAYEELITYKCYATPDREEGMQAFVDKRDPEFKPY